MHLVAVFHDELLGDFVALVEDAADFGVDLLHRRFRDVRRAGHRAAEEDFALVFRVDHRAHLVAHAVAGHHVAGEVCGALEVVRSARRRLIHEDLVGDAAAEHD